MDRWAERVLGDEDLTSNVRAVERAAFDASRRRLGAADDSLSIIARYGEFSFDGGKTWIEDDDLHWIRSGRDGLELGRFDRRAYNVAQADQRREPLGLIGHAAAMARRSMEGRPDWEAYLDRARDEFFALGPAALIHDSMRWTGQRAIFGWKVDEDELVWGPLDYGRMMGWRRRGEMTKAEIDDVVRIVKHRAVGQTASQVLYQQQIAEPMQRKFAERIKADVDRSFMAGPPLGYIQWAEIGDPTDWGPRPRVYDSAAWTGRPHRDGPWAWGWHRTIASGYWGLRLGNGWAVMINEGGWLFSLSFDRDLFYLFSTIWPWPARAIRTCWIRGRGWTFSYALGHL